MFEFNDKNLVFGVLALQLDYIRPDDLIVAANAWMVKKQEPIGSIFVRLGLLSVEDRELLDAVVDKHVSRSGSVENSLASLRHIETDSVIQDWIVQTVDSDNATWGGLTETQDRAGDEFRNSSQRFVALRVLARGGLGQVSVARDHELQREVALKEMLDDREWSADAKARFVAEAKITGGLEHPGIVPVYGMGVSPEGRPYYAMRLIRGHSLQEELNRFHAPQTNGKRLQNEDERFRKLIRSLTDACNAVAYAHSRGVIHRDLKPSNIMLGKFGETLVVDWGLAKTLGKSDDAAMQSEVLMPDVRSDDSAPTIMGSVLGTPSFMSAEQAEGRLDLMNQHSDVFCLGASLYMLLTGKPPYSGPTREDVLSAARRTDFVRPREYDSRIPKALEAVCIKAMARQPTDRYASTVELAEELDRWMAGLPVSAMKEPLIQRTIRWARRHQTLVTACVVLVCVSLVALTIANWAVGVQRDIARNERDTANKLRLKANIATERANDERDIADGLRVKADLATKKAQHNSSVSIEILDTFVKGLADDKWAAVPQLEAERIKMVDLAVDRYSELLDESPDDVRLKSDVVQVLVRSGNLYRMTGRHEKAERQFKRAIEIIDELPSLADNDVKVALLSDALFSLTSVTVSLRGAQEAFPIGDRNLTIARKRLVSSPESLLTSLGLGRVLLQHGELLLELSQADAAEKDAREAVSVFLELSAPLDNQFVVHLFHSYAHTLVARACMAQAKLNDAETAVNEAVRLGEAAQVKFPDNNNVTDFFQKAVIERAKYLLRTGDSKEGTAALLDSLAIYRNLSNDFPQTDGYKRVQVEITNVLAVEFLKNDAKDEALRYAESSLSLISQLAGDEAPITKYLPLQIEALAVLLLASTEDDVQDLQSRFDEARRALELLNPKHPQLANELLQQTR